LSNNLGYEANPFAKTAMDVGYIGLVLMKALGITVIIFLISKFKYNQNLIAYPSVVIAMAVFWNTKVILL